MSLLKFLGATAALFSRLPQRAAASAPAPSVEDLSAATIHDLGLQVDLPQFQPLPHFSLHLPDAVAWLVAGVALAVLLYCLKDLRWRWAVDVREPTLPPVGTTTSPTDHLANAENYAHAGLFAYAMHELLLEGLRVIRDVADDRMADSLTSREILRQAPLPELGKVSLRAIVTGVEWTHFGERPATLTDYLACRASLDTLRSTLRGSAGA